MGGGGFVAGLDRIHRRDGGAAAPKADGEQLDRTRPSRASGVAVAGVSSSAQIATQGREEPPRVDKKSGEATHGTSQVVSRNTCT